MPIYFDNAATTKPCSAALSEFIRVSEESFGNPSSLHSMGVAAEGEVTAAAKIIAEALRVSAEEIYFTSSGTESNNLAIFGAAEAAKNRGNHVITTKIEHPSVMEVFKRLAERGFEVTWLDADENGQIDHAKLEQSITRQTVLASFIHVNNETGSALDISQLAGIVKSKNPGALVHSDGVQAFCKHSTNLKNIDMYTVSAHKIHGVKGVGGLFLRKNTRLAPMLWGGGQQNGVRPGTENPAGAAAMAAAVKSSDKSHARVRAVKEKLAEAALELDNVYINGGDGSPYILNMSFCGVKAEVLLHILAAEGIFASAGAACNGKTGKANVLGAYGISQERLSSALRFSFDASNTVEEAERVKNSLIGHVRAQRKIMQRK